MAVAPTTAILISPSCDAAAGADAEASTAVLWTMPAPVNSQGSIAVFSIWRLSRPSSGFRRF